jgi:hypothetical protein
MAAVAQGISGGTFDGKVTHFISQSKDRIKRRAMRPVRTASAERTGVVGIVTIGAKNTFTGEVGQNAGHIGRRARQYKRVRRGSGGADLTTKIQVRLNTTDRSTGLYGAIAVTAEAYFIFLTGEPNWLALKTDAGNIQQRAADRSLISKSRRDLSGAGGVGIMTIDALNVVGCNMFDPFAGIVAVAERPGPMAA